MRMRKYLAEFIGTFVLVTFGCGSAVAANTLLETVGMPLPLAFSTLLIAFAFGLSIVAMAYSIGNISGCHINPAVSLAMLISGRMSFLDFIGYIIAQFAGGIAGAGILVAMFNSIFTVLGKDLTLGQNSFGGTMLSQTAWNAFLVEVVLSFVFVIVILGVTSRIQHASVSGLVIGLTLTLVHIMGIPFTGTSVNPARSLGPALLVGGEALSQVWVFLVAPLVGAAIAALVYKLLDRPKKEEPEKTAEEVENFVSAEELEAEAVEETEPIAEDAQAEVSKTIEKEADEA